MSETPQRPTDPNRKLIGARIAEERKRVGLDQQQFAALIGNSKRAVAAWETGESMPTAEFVARFALGGLDVLYTITGKRGGNLSAEESALVDLYGRIPPEKRPALRVTAEALATNVAQPGPRAHGVHQVFNAKVGNVQTVHEGDLTNQYAVTPEKKRSRRTE